MCNLYSIITNQEATGARIAEIRQLRSKDIKQIDGIWCIALA